MELEMTHEEALALARSATFRPFGRFDYDSFAGVESALPLIADVDGFTLVVDGHILEVVNENGDYQTFNLRD